MAAGSMKVWAAVAAAALPCAAALAAGGTPRPCFVPSLALQPCVQCQPASCSATPEAVLALPGLASGCGGGPRMGVRAEPGVFGAARPALIRGTGPRDSRLPMAMSGAARRRRIGSANPGDAAPKGPLGQMVALFLAAANWILALLRDIYGQLFVLAMDTLIQKPFLFILNKVEIDGHKRLTDLIGKRPRKTPLITVSNHCSSLDEPLLFSALVGFVLRPPPLSLLGSP